MQQEPIVHNHLKQPRRKDCITKCTEVLYASKRMHDALAKRVVPKEYVKQVKRCIGDTALNIHEY